MPQKVLAIFLIFFSFFLIITRVAKAADFDPSYLISDTELTDYNSLDQNDIQSFLNHRAGTLKNYLTVDKEGNFKTAVQTFFETSRQWMINPKYLLVLVQKEESLLDDPNPSQGQYDWATGYGCPDSGGCDDRWKGFYRQVNSAAAQTRYYMDHINEFSFQPGNTYTIDDKQVTIKNTSTAGLYNYTPHLHGNLNFWNLWNQYFGMKWPDGTLMQVDGQDKIYLIQDGKRREIASKAIFISRFDPNKIVTVDESDLDSYTEGVPIKYLNFSLLQNSAGDIFMIVNDGKRKFSDPALLVKMGFNEDDITKVPDLELALYADGPAITQYSLYPAGILAQQAGTKNLFYLLSGEKRPILTPEILKANFTGLPIKKMTAIELDRFMPGNPVTLPDGWLIKTKKVNTIYVIADGKRLPIYSSAVFAKMKYDKKNIKIVSDDTLNVQPLGQIITGDW